MPATRPLVTFRGLPPGARAWSDTARGWKTADTGPVDAVATIRVPPVSSASRSPSATPRSKFTPTSSAT